jgi:tRNA nucleotidyltransferase/poly(A) polymerase
MTDKFEYPIEKAKEDMDNGIIRMIDDPLKIFVDKPLYLLECIQRAQKLGFKLDDEIKKMYKNETVLKSFEEFDKSAKTELFNCILEEINQEVGL